MSTYWDVYCIPCAEPLGLHENHLEEVASRIASAAAQIAAATRALPSFMFEVYSECNDIIPGAWFVRHAGHQIVARDEYGAINATCGEWVTCVKCDHCCFTCNRKPGHKGDHDPKPDEEST